MSLIMSEALIPSALAILKSSSMVGLRLPVLGKKRNLRFHSQVFPQAPPARALHVGGICVKLFRKGKGLDFVSLDLIRPFPLTFFLSIDRKRL